MSWEERIQTVNYTSPGGKSFNFLYEDLSMSVDKKTTEFLFPDKDGAYVQDLGRAGRKFPFNIIFNGSDYDKQADAFILALEEKGFGKLEHPIYKDRVVVPSGTITRSDNLVSGANQALISVTFIESIKDLTFPKAEKTIKEELIASVEMFQELTAEYSSKLFKTDNASEETDLETIATDSVSEISDPIEPIAEEDENIITKFKNVKSSYESNVKNITSDAKSVIRQATILSRIPARVKTKITKQVAAYKETIDKMLSYLPQADSTNNPGNEHEYNNVVASSGLAAMCESTLYAEIDTRKEAVETSEQILDLLEEINDWQDENITNLDLIDTGESYSELLTVVSNTASYLINESFSLPMEIIETLTYDRNIIEYIASKGLGVETDLDFFIQTNNLTADEIELMPKGLKVVYYV